MEDFNKYLIRHVYQGMDNFVRDQAYKDKPIPSTVDLQQRYGMGWHDAVNVQNQISKQNQKMT
jgi:hypothetical protein